MPTHRWHRPLVVAVVAAACASSPDGAPSWTPETSERAEVMQARIRETATLAHQAQLPAPVGWWRLDGRVASGGSPLVGTWMFFGPNGEMHLDMGVRATGAYRLRGSQLDMLDSAGRPMADMQVRLLGDSLRLMSPDGPLPMRRVHAFGVRGGRAPVGVWHARPLPGGGPIEVQYTEGRCYRLAAMMPSHVGRWAARGDTIDVTMREQAGRAMSLLVRRDGTAATLDVPRMGRFVRSPNVSAMLPDDARCAPPQS